MNGFHNNSLIILNYRDLNDKGNHVHIQFTNHNWARSRPFSMKQIKSGSEALNNDLHYNSIIILNHRDPNDKRL